MLLGTALLAALGFGLGIVAGLVLEEPGLLLDYVTGKTSSAPLDATRSANEFAAAEREKERIDAVARAAARPAAEAAHPETPDVGAAPRESEAAASAKETPNGDTDSHGVEATEKAPPHVAAAPPSAPGPKPATSAAIAADRQAEADVAKPLVPAAPPAGRGYSVQVGALADAASAEQLALKLRKRGFPVYVAPSAEPGSKRWRVRVGPVASREQADELATTLAREKFPTWILAEGPR
jgi:cell division septation protein DedD